jgi:bacterioferritin
MLKNWGVTKLGEHEYKESVQEMKDADMLIERILFLEGIPNLQDLGKLLIGENVEEILQSDLQLEHKAIEDLRAAIAHCETVRDYVSRKMLRDILDDEEGAVDFIETQLALVQKMGLENYIQLQSDSAA